MALHRPGDKPLSKPMMVSLLMHICDTWPQWVNTRRPIQSGQHLGDNFFKCILLNENEYILIQFSLKFVPKGLINDKSALVEIMAWCWQATRHYLNRCRARCVMPFGFTKPLMLTLKGSRNSSAEDYTHALLFGSHFTKQEYSFLEIVVIIWICICISCHSLILKYHTADELVLTGARSSAGMLLT